MNTKVGKMATVAYKRVSTEIQNTERQLEGLAFDKEFEDKLSGKNKERPQLQAMIDYVRDGDIVYIHSLDRLGRNTKDLIEIMETLRTKGVTVIFHKQGLEFKPNTNNPMNDLMFNMLSAFAQFEREILLERQKEGIAIAKAKGNYKGSKEKINKDEIKQLVADGMSYRNIAKKLEISLSTIQRTMKNN